MGCPVFDGIHCSNAHTHAHINVWMLVCHELLQVRGLEAFLEQSYLSSVAVQVLPDGSSLRTSLRLAQKSVEVAGVGAKTKEVVLGFELLLEDSSKQHHQGQ